MFQLQEFLKLKTKSYQILNFGSNNFFISGYKLQRGKTNFVFELCCIEEGRPLLVN